MRDRCPGGTSWGPRVCSAGVAPGSTPGVRPAERQRLRSETRRAAPPVLTDPGVNPGGRCQPVPLHRPPAFPRPSVLTMKQDQAPVPQALVRPTWHCLSPGRRGRSGCGPGPDRLCTATPAASARWPRGSGRPLTVAEGAASGESHTAPRTAATRPELCAPGLPERLAGAEASQTRVASWSRGSPAASGPAATVPRKRRAGVQP